MPSNTESQCKLYTASDSQAQQVGLQKKTGFNNRLSSGAASQRGNLKEHRQVKEPEARKHSEFTRPEAVEDSVSVKVTFS